MRHGALPLAVVWAVSACYNMVYKNEAQSETWRRMQLLFRKRQKGVNASSDSSADGAEQEPRPELYRIDFDMMLKGNVATRRGKQIRQYGVTVDGATRLITSGDLVERKTYEALVAAGVIRPMSGPTFEEVRPVEREKRQG